MKRAHRKHLRPSQFLNGIDVWAFLSVEVALLIILMMIGPGLHEDRRPVDLAPTLHAKAMPGALREDAMLVAVRRDGSVFFRTHYIRAEDLPLAIQEALRQGSERKVYLKVDTRAMYRDAIVVIDKIRNAGIQQIALITEQLQHSTP